MTAVVCALIINNGKVLVVQHGPASEHAFRWEFPGGKVGHSETEEEAIVREIREELELSVVPFLKLESVIYRYPGKIIQLIPFLCRARETRIVLNEHHDFKWLDPLLISKMDLLEADRLILENNENFKQLLHCCR